MTWIDAHNHLHDLRLAPYRDEIIREIRRDAWAAAVVNGTREDDWPAVAALARAEPWVRPAFGLHPWYVAGRSPDWHERLIAHLEAFPDATIGEIGLDRWIEGHDLPTQMEVFRAQLLVARLRQLPVTIHCLRAWGALWDELSAGDVAPRAFLLHAYGGPAEMVGTLEKRGAYFSFSAYFLHERKARQREVFARISLDRLLVETDAPDLAPPPDYPGAQFFSDVETGRPLNTPLNLALTYEALAQIRGLSVADLASQVAQNVERLFGTCRRLPAGLPST